MVACKSSDFGNRVCKVLGLDARIVGRITIDIMPDSVLVATVEQTLNQWEADEIEEILRDYRLELVVDDKGVGGE